MIPILDNKHPDQPSVFDPVNLLREARRQKAVTLGNVPEICVLDPDGDLFRQLQSQGARRNPHWACYHTEMFDLETGAEVVGVVGCAVGASFAVLVAEQLFASGCRFLISVTSAGQIVSAGQPPYFVLIDRALRDEGTSYHYLPAAPYAHIEAGLLDLIRSGQPDSRSLIQGGVWTTDAPFRETAEAIAFARSEGLLAVEMEAAALYAFAEARDKPVVCFAHVTNTMGLSGNDFEKGEADGNQALRELIHWLAQALLGRHRAESP
ncbi:MAG: uridine phosphorylase [Gammaproteobacteria bacterium]|nr:MAG: uridine phosphorylase [Gammaproteobacteria bacterium]